MSVSDNVLGIESVLTREAAESLRSSLSRAWVLAYGTEPADVDADLELTRKWFDPVAQGQRLRKEISELPAFPRDLPDPGGPVSFPLGAGKWLVTPEGRCVLELLTGARGSAAVRIDEAQLRSHEERLFRLYRRWSRHRLESVVDLLHGKTKPLQIPAAGVVLALLVNRCTDEARALTRYASGPEREAVDRAFFVAVQAFSDVLAPSKRRNRTNPHLVSGWMLYEARRRLGNGLIVEDARQGSHGRVWVAAEAQDDIVDVVARDLARGHRVRITTETLGNAFDELVRGLREQLPTLAGLGFVHERPIETARLKNDLLMRFSRHALG